jgi:predicted PurR-regulated permease PerM
MFFPKFIHFLMFNFFGNSLDTFSRMDQYATQLFPLIIAGFLIFLVSQCLIFIKDLILCNRRLYMTFFSLLVSIAFGSGLFFLILPPSVDKLLNKVESFTPRLTDEAKKLHLTLPFISDLHADTLMFSIFF